MNGIGTSDSSASETANYSFADPTAAASDEEVAAMSSTVCGKVPHHPEGVKESSRKADGIGSDDSVTKYGENIQGDWDDENSQPCEPSMKVDKEKQQRIHFKIGKKRKKTSGDVTINKRGVSAVHHHLNVLEEGNDDEHDTSILRRTEATREDGPDQSISDNGSNTSNDEKIFSERQSSFDVTHVPLIQPDGWRVKLYRLNADGSRDDCGSGRIVFLTDTQKTGYNRVDSVKGKEWDALEEEVYHTLGMPTLCMHAEIPTNSMGLTTSAPKVLLRTRVLLRESYQRQGDNIITWCEPCFSPAQVKGGQEDGFKKQEQIESGEDVPCGVDLALSFQDNAGCRDIWNKISKIQHKAYELFRARGSSSVNRGDDIFHGYIQHHYGYDMNHSHSKDSKNAVDDIDSTNHTKSGLENSAHAIYQQHRTADQQMGSDASNQERHGSNMYDSDDDEHDFSYTDTAEVISMAAKAAHYVGGTQSGSSHGKNHGSYQVETMDSDSLSSMDIHLCDPPTLDNLEKIADVIAACQVRILCVSYHVEYLA